MATPPSAYTGIGVSAMSAAKRGQPSVVAPGCDGVAATGESVAKFAPTRAAWASSLASWQDTPSQHEAPIGGLSLGVSVGQVEREVGIGAPGARLCGRDLRTGGVDAGAALAAQLRGLAERCGCLRRSGIPEGAGAGEVLHLQRNGRVGQRGGLLG